MDTDIDFGFLQSHRIELNELCNLLCMHEAKALDKTFRDYAWNLVDGYTTCSDSELNDLIRNLEDLLDA